MFLMPRIPEYDSPLSAEILPIKSVNGSRTYTMLDRPNPLLETFFLSLSLLSTRSHNKVSTKALR